MNITFGQLIRSRRLEYGFKQESFARRIGISQGYLCDLEKGKKYNLCGLPLMRLCMALNISFNELMSCDFDEGI